jgi:hypothetical protein
MPPQEDPMHRPAPSPAAGTGPATPARAAAALTRELTRRGITGSYTATSAKIAVISVTAELTIWTNGTLFWCTFRGQPRTWPADDTRAAAASLAALIS